MISFFYHKYRNGLIIFLFLIGIFIDFKINQSFFFFNIKLTYFFLFIIFAIYLINFKITDTKNIYFFYLFLILIFNLIVNFDSIQIHNFLKQALAIIFFNFIFFNFFNSSKEFLDNFLKHYLNFSVIFCCIGLILYFLVIIFDSKLFYYFFNKQNYTVYAPYIFESFENRDFLEKIYLLANKSMYKQFSIFNNFLSTFLQIKELVRFQGFFSEPSTAGIILLPALSMVLNKKKFILSHFVIIFCSITLTQSIYAYLGLLVILLVDIKRNYKIFLITFIIIFIFSPIMYPKIYDTTKYFNSILNLGEPENIYRKEFNEKIDKFSYKDMDNYVKKYIVKDSNQIRLNKIKYILKKNEYRKNSKITNDDKNEFFKLNAYVTSDYINASSCAYFYNAFVTLQSLKDNLFFGNGLGSYENSYVKYSDSWRYKPLIYSNCYKLNHLDAKTLFLRILSEFGLICFLILISYFIFILINLFFLKNKFIYVWFLCFILKILQLGSFTDMSSYLLLTIALKLYYLKKNNVAIF
jgi:hypothetical protein